MMEAARFLTMKHLLHGDRGGTIDSESGLTPESYVSWWWHFNYLGIYRAVCAIYL